MRDAKLLTDILRGEWGFDGFVVTDWGGSNDHVEGIRAGSNLEMPGVLGDSDGDVLRAYQEGCITDEIIDQRVDELLDVVFSVHGAVEQAARSFDEEAHHAQARRVAAATAVLLKNEGGLLPLASGCRTAIDWRYGIHPPVSGRRVFRGQSHKVRQTRRHAGAEWPGNYWSGAGIPQRRQSG